ncbi:MAG: hypothetical protein ACLQDY_05725 [Streptosporangiaceae bacterium]
MTANRNLKRRVRARAAKTGESYTTALRHFRVTSDGDPMPETRHVRLSVAQTVTPHDPRDGAQLRSAGRGIRQLMREAREQDARLIHFSEGATCSPHKRIMSGDPGKAGQADWDRFDWDVVRQELAETAELARTLRIWAVLGSVHPLTRRIARITACT